MMKRQLRNIAIDAGMRFFETTRADRLLAPLTRGVGAILMFHHVRPASEAAFAPNAGLEITPQFLDAALTHLRKRGYEIVSLDDFLLRLDEGRAQPPAVALTFDDAYRDLVHHALPVLERHRAPFTTYVTSGFADGAARLWWVEMERAIAALEMIDLTLDGERLRLRTRSATEKKRAFSNLYWRLREGGEAALLDAAGQLCAAAGVDARRLPRELCLDWSALEALARHPLATIGSHTMSHPRLAKLDPSTAEGEMRGGAAAIEARLRRPIRHFAYPVGDPSSAGAREFAAARAIGFASAVTTRPGMIFSAHRARSFALPRLSVNGSRQSLRAFDVLLSGAPFAVLNRGRVAPVA